jgi:hypothetical protein
MPRECLVRRLSWAVIGVCTLSLAATASVAAVPTTRDWFVSAPLRGGYRVGVPAGLPVDVLRSKPTVVVYFRPDCLPSQRSTAALAKVIKAAEAVGVDAKLITSSPDEEGSFRFAEAVGLARSRVTQMDLGAVPVARVPTVVVTDANRTVSFVHEGSVTDRTVDSMLPVVRRLGR